MSDSILKQIADLERLPARDLQDRWRELYGSEPPGYNRTFLTKRLAYRLQELAHGGLTDTTRRPKSGDSHLFRAHFDVRDICLPK
jgi:hypothetical protein